mmetsp:Transcript_8254/g.17945  ORF Transcript_8254/g.17945 Transcript_8254/m.17945 type:complete len:261 (-) Transcript_8254:259-1041(-)|eukprot:CAMPEP_0113320016 /NCGR_PEP_ID=MMETSP0010_2-20120614/13984_1 /TAXON_ID=216773 ORGANISM="Corethron hystrix, Strain 308" /NCGR_SAMPLE_ID=MMETSP0010_2 /ASSEMBLY_ACC=CAM_ASM_000155 /LENGTH=260 /DNA_ID=CAMNT_0000177695 /DNA_START=369 /DNA_END=1154 /DNA_ORIENTATION=- /assembly_acc=CAM_ASM_000155
MADRSWSTSVPETDKTKSAAQSERDRSLRDHKVAIEYKHLRVHAPGGVYIVPAIDPRTQEADVRSYHGVVFVRRGPYANGVFKFKLRLPPRYNDVGTYPLVRFVSYVYNPHVHPGTGELDLRTAYPQWSPKKHYLVTVLTFLKKIFYVKSFDGGGEGDAASAPAVANPDAREMHRSDPASYRRRVEECVRDSQRQIYVNEPGSTFRFTEDGVCLKALREMLLGRPDDEDKVAVDGNTAPLTQLSIGDIVKKVENASKVSG